MTIDLYPTPPSPVRGALFAIGWLLLLLAAGLALLIVATAPPTDGGGAIILLTLAWPVGALVISALTFFALAEALGHLAAIRAAVQQGRPATPVRVRDSVTATASTADPVSAPEASTTDTSASSNPAASPQSKEDTTRLKELFGPPKEEEPEFLRTLREKRADAKASEKRDGDQEDDGRP